jgi:carbon monoxide dehydrogenase subunit G
MALDTSGEITVAVDRPSAFAIVRDPARLARCIPGCTELCEVAPDRYTAVITSRVAFMTLRFKVTIDVAKIEPPATLEAKVTGDAVGLSGHVVATARLDLAETADRHTTIHYATEVGLTGKLGSLGQPVLRATSAKLAREFGANLKAEIEGQYAEPSA